jgi:hypothetical protein
MTRAQLIKRMERASKQYAEETLEDLRDLAKDGLGRAKTLIVSEAELKACLQDMFYEGWEACRDAVIDVMDGI